VAQQYAPGATEGMFLLGLLHDVGKSLALRSLASLIVSGELEPVRDARLLEALLEVNHAEIGAIALERFDMPQEVVRTCRLQSDAPQPDDPVACHVVRLVSRLNALRLGPVDTELPMRTLRASAGVLGLDARRVGDVARELSERARLTRELFSVGEAWDEDAFFERVESCMNE
jgi:hypothetical protein